MSNSMGEVFLPDQTEPPEAELTHSRLEQTAHQAAFSHTLKVNTKDSALLLKRLPEQAALLQDAYRHFALVAEEELVLSYAAEWLLDNYYLVQQALRQVEEDLPHQFYQELPKLDGETLLNGYPRVFALARELILYEECQLDSVRLERFIAAYQTIAPLTMGELWALPIMLRLVTLESLAQAVGTITGLSTKKDLLSPALQFDYTLSSSDVVASCIPNLRLLGSLDWREFFERVSHVEKILRDDPSGLYARLTFETRDQYRKVVERLAFRTTRSETNVAREVVRLARQATASSGLGPTPDRPWAGLQWPRQCHVGYYLIDAGRRQLEEQFHYQPDASERLQRWLFNHPTFVYLGSIALASVLFLLGLLSYATAVDSSPWQLLVVALLTFIPAVFVAVQLVNWMITHLISPHLLPKLKFEEGVPAECHTIAVIPALLANVTDAESLLNQLELHHLRNPDRQVSFALLTDFADAADENQPEDEALVATVSEGIEQLNNQYSDARFFLFHRRRLLNTAEGVWMGWERKRGKLHEFNRLLRGATDTSFSIQVGDLATLADVRYVITLDADTILPRGAARRLIGTLAHPLNRAEFDPATGRVVAGYTVLQPRTEILPASANRSLFTRVFAGDTGLDLYTLAVSDVYQDLFQEGIYVGKGIYDVDAFERSLNGRVPPNTLLSHDLFEGIHGRAGLVSDIVLFEDFPFHYLAHVRRSHRWIRGDWQLLPWLLPWVYKAPGWTRNTLALIDRWKIFDNLYRSLLSPSLLLLFLAGWLWLPGSPLYWTVIGLLTPAVPLVTGLLEALVNMVRERPVLRDALRPVRDNLVRWLLFLAFLPYEAILVIDAVSITLIRLLFTRRHLLQWTTAAHTARILGDEVTIEITQRQMLPSLVLTAVVTILTFLVQPTSLVFAVPLLLLWILASEIAHWISRPDRVKKVTLSEDQLQELRRLARRTWFFFEQYVGPDDNWLPPDHFQESPRGVVAHRTSPTNIGLYLLSVLAAHDMGYVGTLGAAVRLRSTFDTLNQLERYRGHFLNWIDTRTLGPLLPRYVSTVDSGNLASSLLVLKQGCLEVRALPVWRRERWQGLLDTLALWGEAVGAIGDDEDGQAFQAHLAEIDRRVTAVLEEPARWPALLLQIADEDRPSLDQQLGRLVEAHATLVPAEQLRGWRLYAERVHHHIQSMRREIELLLPWALLLERPPAFLTARELPPEIAAAWRELKETLLLSPTLEQLAAVCATGQARLIQLQERLAAQQSHDEGVQEALDWCIQLEAALSASRMTVQSLLIGYNTIISQIDETIRAMDFTFLFDRQRQVFHIGYNMDVGRLDNNYYDLLASEARIASLVAIAKHDVPQSHWLHMARPMMEGTGGRTLLSWSGTMFEYLMPPLLMRSYEGTLLHQSYMAAVDAQIAYGRAQGTPWGISESGFYTFDAAFNYQYRAFGVPELGFKRGLTDDLVIAPYASLLALPFRPEAVMQNIKALREMLMLGRYGLYEAVDFTPSRLPLGRKQAIVRSYMAHHQGMIMLALANFLQGSRFVERFHAEPSIRSIELLLQEQIPQKVPVQKVEQEEASARPVESTVVVQPWSVPADSPLPLVHFLSNGHYSLLITNAGAGYSTCGDTALTRWRPDTTLDDWGMWLYVQDIDSGARWSAGSQPLHVRPDHQEVLFHPHMAQFRRRDNDISLEMEVFVAPNDDVEIRHITVTNDSDVPRHLRLTSYAEVVLAPAGADIRHPAFVKLFVESEYLPATNALVFRRRPRSDEEPPAFLAHMLILEREEGATGAYESDRARFLGRGRTARDPAVLSEPGWLTGTTGATLDPVMALGQEITVEPRESVRLAIMTLAAESRTAVLGLLERYQNWAAVQRALTLVRSQAERELRRLDLPTAELERIQQLLSVLIYPQNALRANESVLAANEQSQPGLWSFGISGDYPILLLQIHDESEGELLQTLLRAHAYWRRRNLRIDLVILNEQITHYGQQLQRYIQRMIHRLDSDHWLNRRGGIFVLRHDQLKEADYTLLQTAARALLDGARGSLQQQLSHLLLQPTHLPAFVPTVDPAAMEEEIQPLPRPDALQFDNGFGGFSPDGREYIIYLEPGMMTPAPWINVIANDEFGFLASETGSGYSWAVNSGENRLTTWRNDPVSDEVSEALYLRDEETAEIWSPMPRPTPADAPYLVRHGAGYSIFEHHSHGLKQRVRLFAAPDSPVKIVQLRLENRWRRTRRLTVTYYAEWVLGPERSSVQQYIVPEYDETLQALLARNPYSLEFDQRVAFVAASHEPHGLTADRKEFLGRLGSLQSPAGLRRIGLESRVQPGLDPCAVLQLHLDLPPGDTQEVYFLVGQSPNREEAHALIRHYQDEVEVDATWRSLQTMWDEILGAVTVRTPDRALDLLLNRWLLYQALACRIWGRSALYQSSGAYGFRDQLQDVMSLLFTRPDLAREQILRAARHQFDAGDVLHWWHPPSGRGVRTRISDDLLWLPHVTAHYVLATGDETILDEQVPFLKGEPLRPEEEERYGYYEHATQTETLFEHCRRALQKGTTAGVHGLPLMGGGDWNDGMNRVGIEGRGESVWLAWFLIDTLNHFATLCERLARADEANGYRQDAEKLREAVEEHGWDGAWYRRAYYDDGTPLGSMQNQECRIDAISQSWAVLSGAASADRARRAMTAVEEWLLKWDERLLLLLTPPFDQTIRDPGYIKGYLPGIRENGGQYTHAALWTIWAFARSGRGDLVDALFRLINPVYRADTQAGAEHYKVEPYVIAADVYGVAPHAGRGGWSWYTGSSGWMYRLGVEAILGLQRSEHGFWLEPCICSNWPGYHLTYRYRGTTYEIEVLNPDGVQTGVREVTLNGELLSDGLIPFQDDGQLHQVKVRLGGISVE